METLKKFKSIWWTWIFFVIIFIILFAICSHLNLSGGSTDYLIGFLGLFTSFNIITFITMVLYSTISPVIVFIICMIFSDKILNKYTISFYKRIIINLFLLLIITVIVDLVARTDFAAWNLFISGMKWNPFPVGIATL